MNNNTFTIQNSASSSTSRYVKNPIPQHTRLIFILQEEPSGHVVAQTTGPNQGKFTFTSHEAADHSICLSTNYTTWFSHTHIRLHLDIVVGSTKADVEHDRSHVSELASKLRDLNQKLEDIRREQQYQREREADFRDLSESTNSRAVWYSVVQIIVLIVTCVWQLRHLKVCPSYSSTHSSLNILFLAFLRRQEDAINALFRYILFSSTFNCTRLLNYSPNLRRTFFPYLPCASLPKTCRSLSVAVSSSSFFSTVTTSC